MSFWPFKSNFWCVALSGLACLTLVGAVQAGNIEVVPFHNGSTDTNFDKPVQDDSHSFKVWSPTAPSSAAPAGRPNRITPPPPTQSQQTLSKEEQQLLDRRRNWVFMTPEDYANSDSKDDKNPFSSDNNNNMTAMERFYHRLEQSSKSAETNAFSQINSDRSNSQTNLFDTAGLRNNNTADPNMAMFGQTPFSSSVPADAGVFQSITSGNGGNSSSDSGNVFGSSSPVTAQSPEEVRAQAAQKAHMENFKQLWDIDQATRTTTATTPVSPVAAPSAGGIDSAPLFGASTPGIQSPFRSGQVPANLTAGTPAKSPAPVAPPPAPPRYTPPTHSDFMPQQRPF